MKPQSTLLSDIPASLRVTQRTPQARHGVVIRRRILKLLSDLGPATTAELAEDLEMEVHSVYKHVRILYKDSIHVGFWNRRYSNGKPSGWTAIFAIGKQPDAPYPTPQDPRTILRRKPDATHTWGIPPKNSAPDGPSPSH